MEARAPRWLEVSSRQREGALPVADRAAEARVLVAAVGAGVLQHRAGGERSGGSGRTVELAPGPGDRGRPCAEVETDGQAAPDRGDHGSVEVVELGDVAQPLVVVAVQLTQLASIG